MADCHFLSVGVLMFEDEYVRAVWRTGRTVGRTIYAQRGGIPSDTDPLIGVMDTRELAEEAVDSHNRMLGID